MEEIIGSSILIVGYGLEGKSIHQYLHKHYPTKKIGIADQKEIKPIIELPADQLYFNKDYLQNIHQYDLIIKSAGIPPGLLELQKYIKSGKRITTETNIFFSKCPGKIVGITGTKGKSTTSSLISTILSQKYTDVRLVGNIGRPALDYLEGSDSGTIFVMEISSYQLEDIHYSPHIAVLLAVFQEHLNYHGNLLKYIKAKSNIFKYQTLQDSIIFNPSHKVVSEIVSKSETKKFKYSLYPRKDAVCYLKEKDIIVRTKEGETKAVLKRNEIPLLGEGNLENTIAAITTGVLFKVPLTKIRTAVLNFKSLEHRLELVGEYNGIRFYNDSLATIPEATINALKALGNDVETLIVGGYDRGIDFSKLGLYLGKSQLKSLIVFSPSGQRIWGEIVKSFLKKELNLKKYEASSMEEAIRIAFETTLPGKICLLSPASSSFGLFRDYQERGELFKKSIIKLGKPKS